MPGMLRNPRSSDGGWLGGLVQHQRRREAKRRPRLVAPPGGGGSFVLGLLSAGIGLLVFGLWCAGLSGVALPQWFDGEVPSRSSEGEAEPDSFVRADAVPIRVVVPTVYSGLLSVLGSLIAGFGLYRAYRLRHNPPLLCVIGIALCWAPLLAASLQTLMVALM